MERLLYDARHALRQLSRAPAFALTAILILGLGIGSSTAVFSVVDNILFRPLDLPDSDRLVTICEAHQGDRAWCTASPPNVLDWQANARSLAAVGVARDRGVELRIGDRVIGLPGAMATPGFLHAVGVRPLHGRLLSEEDMLPHGTGSVIVLGYDLWQSEFGGDPRVIGTTVLASSGGDGRVLRDEPVTIIGILPSGVEVPRLRYARAWIPLQMDARAEDIRSWRGFVALGRLAPDVKLAGAQEELNRIHASLAEAYPDAVRNWSVQVVRARDWVVRDVRTLLLLFLAAVAVVLAIVCVNLMSLLLARATRRERELTVCAALGASRTRLVAQLLVEAGVLALLGGVAGVLFASWLLDAFLALAPPGVPRITEVTLDRRVVGFSIGVTAGIALLFGLAPAARIRGMRLHDTLKLARTLTGDRREQRTRRVLVVVQLAMTLTLLLSAGLLLRSFGRAAAFDPGFQLEGLLTFQVFPPQWRYPAREQRAGFYANAEAALKAIPGVVSAGTASAGPLFGGGDGRTPFLVHGRPPVPIQEAPTVQWYNAGPGYFPTLGVTLRAGRNLSEQDRTGSTTVALISESMAALHWPNASPIGARVSLPQWEADVEIVGVVPDMLVEPGAAAEPAIYVSDRQRPRGATYFVVRTTVEPAALVPVIRSVFASLDPEVEPRHVMTAEALLGERLVTPRFNMLLLALFAIIALVLSAAGLYALIAYTVATRTREFGIRMALGAQRAQVLRSVLLDAGRLLSAGLLLGLVGVFYFTRLLRGVIQDVAPTDPLAVGGAVLLLGVTAAVASLAPALRASRTQPASVLRGD